LVSALECVLGRKPGELGHEPDEADASHAGDEGVVLRHETDQAADLPGMGADIVAEDAGGPGGWLMESEQRVEKRRFSRSVRSEEPDGAAGQRGLELFENGARAEAHFEAVQLDHGVHYFTIRLLTRGCSGD